MNKLAIGKKPKAKKKKVNTNVVVKVSDLIKNITKQPEKKKQKQKKQKSVAGNNNADGTMKIASAKLAAAYTTYDKVVEESVIEEVVEIKGNGGEGVRNYAFYINPGNTELFPVFGSSIAPAYTRYELLEFQAVFVTTSGQFVSTTQSGQVCIAINYDAQEGFFPNTKEGFNLAMHLNPRTVTPIFQTDGLMAREKKIVSGSGFTKKEYIVFPSPNQAVPSGTLASVNDYTPGILNVMISNCPVADQVGRLIVSAKFRLWKYRMPNPANTTTMAHYTLAGHSGAQYITGTNLQVGSSKFFNATFEGNVMTLKPNFTDVLILANQMCFTPTTATTDLEPGIAGGEFKNVLNGQTAGWAIAATGDVVNSTVVFSVDLSPVTITWPAITYTGGGACKGDLFLSLFPTNLVTLRSMRPEIDERLSKVTKLFDKLFCSGCLNGTKCTGCVGNKISQSCED
jgi:hypothetical protein